MLKRAAQKEIKKAVTAVLENAAYKACAQRMSQDLIAAGGAAKAADYIERIAAKP